MVDWQSLSRADTTWLSPSMAKRIQAGDEITITTTRLAEAGKVNPDGTKYDFTHHFTFRVSVQRNGTAMCADGLRHDVPALHYDISDSADYSAERQKGAMEQMASNNRMHQRIMRAYTDGYKAVQSPKYARHSAIIMDATTNKMREIKASPWETIGGLLIREGYKREADTPTLQTITNLGPLPSTTRMEHFGSMSGTSSDTEIPEGWVIITTMAGERKRHIEATISVQTLLIGNQPHDVRMAGLDLDELKNASAQDILNTVTGSDNWTSTFSCCKLQIGSNKLPTETSKRLMHPDKWTTPSLREHMGGDISLMAVGYVPATEEAASNTTAKAKTKTNRTPQHSNLTKSSPRALKLAPGHAYRGWYERDDDQGEGPPRPPRPPSAQPVQPAVPEASSTTVHVMRLKSTFPEGQVAPMNIPLAFRAHAEDGALTITDSNSLLIACSRLAGGETPRTGQLMEVTVCDTHHDGAMKTRHRGINYKTRLSVLNAIETDRIVLWDSTSNNIMSRKEDTPSIRVLLHVDPPPEAGNTVAPDKYTIGTFPLPFGDVLDADMHTALQDGMKTWCNSHFQKLQIQPSMAMPDDAHIIKFQVTRVFDTTRTWTYDSKHTHGGCFRKDATKANVDAEQDIDQLCVIIHLAAPCTHMILNQIMPGGMVIIT